jgi:ubiquitin carboxyl-terminal hydrolase 7
VPIQGNANETKDFDYYIQCNSSDPSSSSWSCQASAELRVCSHKKKDFSLRFRSHITFTAKQNAWGFKKCMPWVKVIDPNEGFINDDDSVTFEVKVTADPPQGVFWDSKKNSGFVGLENRSATGYINSVLQVTNIWLIF